LGSRRINRLPDEQEFHRVRPGQALGHADGANNSWDADAYLRKAECGAFRREHEVAERYRSHAIAEARAIDRSDRWFEEFEPTLKRVDRRLLPESASESPGRASVPDVGTGTENPSGPGEDGHPGICVVAEAQPGHVQRLAHRSINSVHALGPVIGDGDDMAVLLVEHGV